MSNRAESFGGMADGQEASLGRRNEETALDGVGRELVRGSRVLLMVRHAERPHIDPEDPTFGEGLPITEAGERDAHLYGERLAAQCACAGVGGGDVQFLSSPLHRTRLTAAAVARGMGLDARWNYSSIPCHVLIGNGSPYYADAREVWQLFRDGEFYRHSFEYCRSGAGPGFRPLAEATQMLEDFAVSRFTGRIGVFLSHDLFIAAFLSGRGVWSGWTVETWPQFLDAAAVILRPDGSRAYALVRGGVAAAREAGQMQQQQQESVDGR